MDYRNERDALRGRVESLEQQLVEAKKARPRTLTGVVIVALAIVAAIAVGVAVAARRASAAAEAAARHAETCHKADACCRANRGTICDGPSFDCERYVDADAKHCDGGSASSVASVEPAESPPAAISVGPVKTVRAPPPDPTGSVSAGSVEIMRNAHAPWSARVTRATGSGPPPGTACTIDAKLEGGSAQWSLADLTVRCGGRTLYHATDQLEGQASMREELTQQKARDAMRAVFVLVYDDIGTRIGARNEVSINSAELIGAVWRTSVPAFHVDFRMSKLSAPVTGL
jgi:hypothetical protein